MHRSRLAGFIIDCKTDNLEQAAQFWSAALGYELRPKDEETSPLYRCMLTAERVNDGETHLFTSLVSNRV